MASRVALLYELPLKENVYDLVASQYSVAFPNQEAAVLTAFFHRLQVELRLATALVAVVWKLHWAIRVVFEPMSMTHLLVSAGTHAKGVCVAVKLETTPFTILVILAQQMFWAALQVSAVELNVQGALYPGALAKVARFLSVARKVAEATAPMAAREAILNIVLMLTVSLLKEIINLTHDDLINVLKS